MAGFAWAGTLPLRATDAVVRTNFASLSSSDGSLPSGLIRASDGNFYGVTELGGKYRDGTVFQLTPSGEATLLHQFSGTDGQFPENRLVQGSDGNLYGTTTQGVNNQPYSGDGCIFRITLAGGYTILYTFTEYTEVLAPLVEGPDGNFYGTAAYGGLHGDGSVFRITPGGDFSLLHSFDGSDGLHPAAALVVGRDGNLYGTTPATSDGPSSGTVFTIVPGGGFATLHRFSGQDGATPAGALVEGENGVFYGVTTYGGTDGSVSSGTVFRVTSGGDFVSLYSFNHTDIQDGVNPYDGLVQGGDGFLYGTTTTTFYKITPAGALTTVYRYGPTYFSSFDTRFLREADGPFYSAEPANSDGTGTTFYAVTFAPTPSSYFDDQVLLADGIYYLLGTTSTDFMVHFGYYSYLGDRRYLYSFRLGYEYVFDAADGRNGIYFYDFKSGGFFYTSPTFPYPYLYDFSLGSVVYYFPGPDFSGGGYDVTDLRYFYVFKTGQIIRK